MYYRDLSTADVGKFEGFAEAETDNEYDSYAVAIHSNNGIHLGYIPRENILVHQHILENNGTGKAYGYVAFSNHGGYYGEICILYNKESHINSRLR